jgi:hypothetical protein
MRISIKLYNTPLLNIIHNYKKPISKIIITKTNNNKLVKKNIQKFNSYKYMYNGIKKIN